MQSRPKCPDISAMPGLALAQNATNPGHGRKQSALTHFCLSPQLCHAHIMQWLDEPEGTKPLAEAASIQHILMMMIVHLSRKILYGVDISHRVGMYIVGTLILSVISDFSNESKSYLSRKDNMLNIYFVKVPFSIAMYGTHSNRIRQTHCRLLDFVEIYNLNVRSFCQTPSKTGVSAHYMILCIRYTNSEWHI